MTVSEQYTNSREPEMIFSRMRIVAQDPRVPEAGPPLTAIVDVPADRLADGPRGHRFRVIDYDAGADLFHPPARIEFPNRRFPGWGYVDPFASDSPTVADLIGDDPGRAFRCQNVYAIASRTLAVFESALGRRLPWGFDADSHELYLVPHAFAEANAYYSRDDQAIYFGYVHGPDGPVYTSLSHDIIAHETAHAVLDGLRPGFMRPGLADQRAFHEAFADIVALLSVFSIDAVVRELLGPADEQGRIPKERVATDSLEANPLFKLAGELGDLFSDERGNGLRRSVAIVPNTTWRDRPEYRAPHRRGEVLVAAVMHTLVAMWKERLTAITREGHVDRVQAAEEGSKSAKHLLAMAIRAIDYTPPTEFEFEDFIAAVLRSDREMAPNDRHQYREKLAEGFAGFGIVPQPDRTVDLAERSPIYSGVNFEALRSMRDEMYRFIWANADDLGVSIDHYLTVKDVRPSVRFGPDGLIVHEIVATYTQRLDTTVGELAEMSRDRAGRRQVVPPSDLDPDTLLAIRGGGTLIFDQFGMVKYHCPKPLLDWRRQRRRLDHLHESGRFGSDGRLGFSSGDSAGQAFAGMHVPKNRAGEDW